MASPAGNPNHPATAAGINMLFKPPTPTPNPNPNPNPNGPFPSPSSSSPYPPPLSPAGAFSYPPPTPPFHHNPYHLHYPQAPTPISYPIPSPHLPNPSPNPNPNDGAHIMALLGSAPPPLHHHHLESVSSMPPPSPMEFPPPILRPVPSAPPVSMVAPAPAPAVPVPARLPSSKMPRGRHLGGGEWVGCDVDARLPGEGQPPQLEVTPITKYTSDPGLVLGRQIAVNRTYICYGLKLGAIRVLNINTALRSLLRGHTQRVTDMAFFAEDVHLLASASVDGRVFVWKIDEGPDAENKPQITGKIIIAIQIVDGESYHPRICWHSHKQEVLIVGIGNRVLKIDTTKVGRGKEFSAEEPLRCPIEKLIDGIQLIGKHDGEVTDLSISQWMTTRLVSASKDGTVKIWDDRKTIPLAVLKPHDGQPVNSVAFLTSPHRPDHIVLITAGPLNRVVKIWTSTSEEGWLLPSDSESWQCTQTLELRSSAEPRPEEAFFNQVVVLPKASLILLANAKKNAIYAVHVDYGPCPASTRMDYIADFTVTMPILSLTGTSDTLPDGEQVVQVYCVQTQAIQQYALDLTQCLPPSVDNALLGKDSGISHVFDSPVTEGFVLLEPSRGPVVSDFPVASAPPMGSSESASVSGYPVTSAYSDVSASYESAASSAESKPSAPPLTNSELTAHVASPPVPLNLDLSGRLSALRNTPKGFDHGAALGDRIFDQAVLEYSADGKMEAAITNVQDVPSVEDNSEKVESKAGINDIAMVPNSHLVFKLAGNTTHLITPSEILSGAISSSESNPVIQSLKDEEVKVHDVNANNNMGNTEVEVKVLGESGLSPHEQFDSRKETVVPTEKNDIPYNTVILETSGEKPKESSLTTENHSVVDTRTGDDISSSDTLEQLSGTGEEEVQDNTKDIPEKVTESAVATAPQTSAKGKKQKAKQSQPSGASSPSSSPFNSIDSLNDPGSSTGIPSTDAALSQLSSMQETLNQLVSMQKEMQKQMSVMMAVPVTKEGRRVEVALGRSMEKAIKANVDALWARLQEENAKHDKAEKERTQQLTSLITSCLNKDLLGMLERALKKEISSVAPSLTRTITPVIEKAISSAITDSFQRGVGDKAVNQLEKSVNSKLEATVARQIQAQFQTSGKQVLQDTLRSSLESSVIPAFEHSCKAMFEQVDAVFQKGMIEHTAAAQQQFDTTHTPLALTLRDAINSASSITQNFTSELADGQRKLLALVAGNSKALNPMTVQQSNGPMAGLSEMALSVQQVEAPLDPTKELSRLISERKFGDAFTLALQRSDVSIVSWLCSQVDLHGICSMVPLPLNQGVLLALLQQLACDINNETARKLGWMTDVAVAINPTDPMITMHVRPIFEQVYNILAHQRSLPTTTSSEASSIRLIMHVINSVLMSCK